MYSFFKYNILSIYSLLILVLIYFQAKVNLKSNDNSYNRMWLFVITEAFFIQMFDIISWIYVYFKSPFFLVVSYASNCLLFILMTVFTSSIAKFMEYSIDFSQKTNIFLKKLFLPLIVINGLMTLLSIPFGFYFSYSESGYIRGNLNFLFAVITYLPLVTVFFRITFKYKTNSQLKSLLFTGLLIPIAFTVIHLLNVLPIPIIFPSATLSIVIMNSLLINNSMCSDFLTGLQNRRGISRFFSNLPPSAENYIVAIYLDINNFKNINDRFGHKEGDIALSSFAKILNKVTKSTDLCARAGGDEFLIVSLTAYEREINLIIDRLKSELDKYNTYSKKPYKLSFSYGMYILKPGSILDKDKLIEEADRRMYIQKNAMRSFNSPDEKL